METIKTTAEELGDTLTEKIVKGGHSTVYFGEKYVYKLTERKVMEKSSLIHKLLTSSQDSSLSAIVPKTILHRDLGTSSLVVEELKLGHHPLRIDESLLIEIVNILASVHKIQIDQVLTNFEGDATPVTAYWNHQLEQAKKFADKLMQSGGTNSEDGELIHDCLHVIEQVQLKGHMPPKLVMVYKDVHVMNILVGDNDKLSAIIDWDSSMSGPIELEYVVLWHRYPKMWDFIRPETLDKDTFVVAGLVQSLRFWKSFTKDSQYVDMQREALKRTLRLYGQIEENWISSC